MVDVRDNGEPSKSATCEATIQLFEEKDTVTVVIGGAIIRTTLGTLEEIFSDILNMDVDIVQSNEVSPTQLDVDLIARDSNNNLIPADELAALIKSLDDSQKVQLITTGLTIIDVNSNAPQVTTAISPVPTRPIPAWAVAIIVVMNSAILVGVLLIILLIVWRRYRR